MDFSSVKVCCVQLDSPERRSWPPRYSSLNEGKSHYLMTIVRLVMKHQRELWRKSSIILLAATACLGSHQIRSCYINWSINRMFLSHKLSVPWHGSTKKHQETNSQPVICPRCSKRTLACEESEPQISCQITSLIEAWAKNWPVQENEATVIFSWTEFENHDRDRLRNRSPSIRTHQIPEIIELVANFEYLDS